jgi:ParB-like chromosome segregation protein Spo0J
MKIVEIAPQKLIDYDKNAKKHPKDQIEKLAKSFQKEGFHGVVVADENLVIIAGHGRKYAAIEAKLDVIPVQILEGLTEEQKRSKRLGDNKLAESDWIDELIKDELTFLHEQNYDVSLSGFDLNFDNINENNDKKETEKVFKNIFEVVVECLDELEQQEIYTIITDMGKKCRILSM